MKHPRIMIKIGGEKKKISTETWLILIDTLCEHFIFVLSIILELINNIKLFQKNYILYITNNIYIYLQLYIYKIYMQLE